jgi:hypothetical protein
MQIENEKAAKSCSFSKFKISIINVVTLINFRKCSVQLKFNLSHFLALHHTSLFHGLPIQ